MKGVVRVVMSARIPPVEAPYSPEAAAVLRRMMPDGETPLALFRLYARKVPLAEALHGWGSYELSRRLGLGLRDREILDHAAIPGDPVPGRQCGGRGRPVNVALPASPRHSR